MYTKTIIQLFIAFFLFNTAHAQINSGMTAKYYFNGNANDEVNTNNGAVNGASLTTDRFGISNSAYSFDGINDNINFGDAAAFRFSDKDFAVSIWIDPDNNAQMGTFLGKSNPNASSNFNSYALAYKTSAGLIQSLTFGDANSTADRDCSSNAINNAGWTHVVLVHTAAEDRLYINGSLRDQDNTNIAGSLYDMTGYPLVIGNKFSTNNNFFKGKIDDIRLYNRALSPNEVLILFGEQPPCNEPANLQVNASSNSATLSWGFVPFAQSYTVRGGQTGGSKVVTFNSTSTSLNVSGLETSTSYYWEVRANCGNQSSSFSEKDTFTTLGPFCGTPKNLNESNVSSTSATLSWDASPFAVNYIVRGSVGSYDKTNLVYVSTSSTSISLNSLSQGTTYFWQVQAACNNTPTPVSPYSGVRNFTTSNSTAKLTAENKGIYPNPATDKIYVESDHVIISDLSGKKIVDLKNQSVIDVSSLNNGAYLVFTYQNGTVNSEKLIIAR